MALIGAPLKAAKRLSLRGAFYTRTWRGLVVASVWPRERKRRASEADRSRQQRLVDLNTAVKYATADEIASAIASVHGTPFLWRDLLTSQYAGHQIAPIDVNGVTMYPETFRRQVIRALDTLGRAITGPLYRHGDHWRAVRPAAATFIYTSQGPDQPPSWTPPP